jgi:hypothetical protein
METQHGRFQNILVQRWFHFLSVLKRIRKFFGPLGSGSVIVSIHQAKKVRILFCDFFTTSKTDVQMNLQKVICKKRSIRIRKSVVIRTKMLRIHNKDFCILTRTLSKHNQYHTSAVQCILGARILFQSSHLYVRDNVKKTVWQTGPGSAKNKMIPKKCFGSVFI